MQRDQSLRENSSAITRRLQNESRLCIIYCIIAVFKVSLNDCEIIREKGVNFCYVSLYFLMFLFHPRWCEVLRSAFVCLSVYLCSHVSKATCPNLTEFSVYVIMVALARSSPNDNATRICYVFPFFADVVIFSYNGSHRLGEYARLGQPDSL